MSDLDCFRDILGVAPDAPRDQIRGAYRRLVMENHPDRFPPENKPVQELTMIALTEAYAALMKVCAEREPVHRPSQGGRSPRPEAPTSPATAGSRQIAVPSDPAYAHYKQGFINFSLAVHGIAETNRSITAGRLPDFTRRYTAAQYFATSLGLLEAARVYFSAVVRDHPDSVWCADSRLKLRRIERFRTLYARILENIRGM